MTRILLQLAAEHSLGFVLTSLVICLVAGWLLAELTRRVTEANAARRLR